MARPARLLNAIVAAALALLVLPRSAHAQYSSCQDWQRDFPDGLPGSTEYVSIRLRGTSDSVFVRCDMTRRGGGWTRVFHHDYSDGRGLAQFGQVDANRDRPTARLYSIMSDVAKLKFDNGPYEFMMEWPGSQFTELQQWMQPDIGPLDEVSLTQLVAINTPYQDRGFIGLHVSDAFQAAFDGSLVGWAYAIMQNRPWGGGLYGPGAPVAQATLWVRAVTCHPNCATCFGPGPMQCRSCRNAEQTPVLGDCTSGALPQYGTCADILAANASATSGTYVIRARESGEFFRVYCDMAFRGGGWTRVFRHDISNSAELASTRQIDANVGDPEADLYSIMSQLPSLRNPNGPYEFRMEWPGSSYTGPQIWRQSDVPTGPDEPPALYTPVDVTYTSRGFFGLQQNSSFFLATFDGSNGTWAYAVMQNQLFNGGLYGPDGPVTQAALWVRQVECDAACVTCFGPSPDECIPEPSTVMTSSTSSSTRAPLTISSTSATEAPTMETEAASTATTEASSTETTSTEATSTETTSLGSTTTEATSTETTSLGSTTTEPTSSETTSTESTSTESTSSTETTSLGSTTTDLASTEVSSTASSTATSFSSAPSLSSTSATEMSSTSTASTGSSSASSSSFSSTPSTSSTSTSSFVSTGTTEASTTVFSTAAPSSTSTSSASSSSSAPSTTVISSSEASTSSTPSSSSSEPSSSTSSTASSSSSEPFTTGSSSSEASTSSTTSSSSSEPFTTASSTSEASTSSTTSSTSSQPFTTEVSSSGASTSSTTSSTSSESSTTSTSSQFSTTRFSSTSTSTSTSTLSATSMASSETTFTAAEETTFTAAEETASTAAEETASTAAEETNTPCGSGDGDDGGSACEPDSTAGSATTAAATTAAATTAAATTAEATTAATTTGTSSEERTETTAAASSTTVGLSTTLSSSGSGGSDDVATSTVVGASLGAAAGLLLLLLLLLLLVGAVKGGQSGSYVVNEDLNPELIVHDHLGGDMENELSDVASDRPWDKSDTLTSVTTDSNPHNLSTFSQ